MNLQRRVAAALLLAVLLSTTLHAGEAAVALPPLSKPSPGPVQAINETELRMHLSFLASPELGGRYTLSPGFAIAARYLASRLESYGFKGAGEKGSFFQPFELVASKPQVKDMSLKLTLGGQTRAYNFGDFFPGFGSPAGSAEGALVFAGQGVSATRLGHDDYEGLDVKGKVVVLAPGTPPGIDASALKDEERGAGAARAHGAVGIINLPSAMALRFMAAPNIAERLARNESIRLAGKNEGGIPTVTVNAKIAEALLAPVGLSLAALEEKSKAKEKLQPEPIDGTAAISVVFEERREKTQNVVGILEGTDPKLKSEYIAFGAHYDHLKTNARGESYPGADDDGSGTTAVLTIARAMSLQRPKRSVFIIFHAAEELGLLGAEYNTDINPAVPLDRIITNLNIDMIGRSRAAGDTSRENEKLADPDSVYLVGSNRISHELHAVSEQANAESEKLRIDYTYNDPSHPERFYFRSDHWLYAKHGVPVVFYFTGTHADYHRTTDTVDKIDFRKLQRVTRLVYETGWRLANFPRALKKDVEPAPAAAGATAN
jgi:Zn-dependent M28 family amino/carboxypeptidase